MLFGASFIKRQRCIHVLQNRHLYGFASIQQLCGYR